MRADHAVALRAIFAELLDVGLETLSVCKNLGRDDPRRNVDPDVGVDAIAVTDQETQGISKRYSEAMRVLPVITTARIATGLLVNGNEIG